MTEAGRDARGALVGVVITAIFGILWTLWGASGLGDPIALVVRLVGVVIGAALVAGSIRAVRKLTGGPGPGSMLTDRRYRLIVVGEVVAIIIGGLLLSATGNAQYGCPWVAFVVGVHFLLFGRIFWPGFRVIGFAIVAAAVLGTVLGLVTADRGVIVATTALISAGTLFVAGGYTLVGTPEARAA